jgi:predicted CopG family antitoxin
VETTTIQIEKPTKDLLNELKPAFNAKTFDEVIIALVKTKTKGAYGKFANKPTSFEKMIKELRDKNDRF